MTARQRTKTTVRRRFVGSCKPNEFGGAILNSVAAHIAVLDRRGQIVAVNAAWRKFATENGLHGERVDSLAGVGTNYLEVCRRAAADSAESTDAVVLGIRCVLDGDASSFSLEYPCHSPTVERWYAMTTTPLVTKGFQGAVVLHTDISARKLAEQEKLESDQRLAADFADLKRFHEISMRCVSSEDVSTTLRDIVSLAVNVTQADMGAFLLLNSTTGELELKAQVGFEPAFIVSGFRLKTDRVDSASVQAVHTKRQVVVPDICQSLIFAASPLLETFRVIGAKAMISTPLVSRDGRVLGTFVTLYRQATQPNEPSLRRLELMARQAADLIERFDSERALRRSEQRFVQFMQRIPGPAWIKDEAGKYIEINDAAADAFGKTRAEVCGRSDHDILLPAEAERLRKNDLLVLASGQSMQFSEVVNRTGGALQHFLVNKFPIPNPHGDSSLVGGMSIDITDRKQSEDTLRQIIDVLSPTTGYDFFRALVVHLTQTCDVNYAFVAQLDDGNASSAKTIAVAHDGKLVDNFVYALQGSPCEHVLEKSFCHISASACEQFAGDAVLASRQIDSYMRIALLSANGNPIGLIALMHRRPIAQPERAEAILRIVASRAAAELERERAEAALRANEIRLQTVLDHATDALFLHDAKTRLIDVNRQACDSLGYTRHELVGMMPAQFDPHAKAGLSNWVIDRLNSGETIAFDSEHKRKDGTLFPVEVRIRPFWIDGKRYALSLARDITERKRTEEAIRSTQRRLALILHHADVGLWDWDLKTNEAVFSPEWKSQLGYEGHEIANHLEEWQSRVHPDDLGPALANVNETIQRGEGVYDAEFRMRHKDGSWRWILARGSIVQSPDGLPAQMVGIHLDITERKRAGAALRGQLRVLERIATGEPLSTILDEVVALVEEQLSDSQCSILLLNEDGTKLHFGAGKNLPPSYSAAIDGVGIGPNVGSCGTAAFLKKSIIVSDIATDPLWKDYRELALKSGLGACWSAPIFAGGATNGGSGASVLGTFALYSRQPATPSETDIQIVSAAANLAGIAIERHRSEATIRDNEDRLRTLLENLQNVAVQAFEPDGTITFWNKVSERVYGHSAKEALGHDIVDLLHSEATRASERQMMADALGGSSLPEPAEFEVLRRDGVKITVLSSRVLHQRPGRPPEFFCFDVDVTDKKRAEEELALRQAELAHASRLSTLGQMVAALSHEVAQPLTAIGNFASAIDHILGRETLPAHEKLHEYVQAISQQTQRCTAILLRLRDFSRRSRPLRSSCDLRQLINTSIALVANELKRQSVTLRTHIAQELPLITVDQIQLQQVIVNLITNACDAVRDQSEPRRKIMIRARKTEHDCELVVEDAGAGFSAEAASRLFEPFFTTKPEGMGIGLNVCESIVRSHGGEISASINQKGGATFLVRLPLAESVQV